MAWQANEKFYSCDWCGWRAPENHGRGIPSGWKLKGIFFGSDKHYCSEKCYQESKKKR